MKARRIIGVLFLVMGAACLIFAVLQLKKYQEGNEEYQNIVAEYVQEPEDGDEDDFYLIDQHAAQERIFYERLVSQYENDEKVRQPMLMPILIDVDISCAEKEDVWKPVLDSMGFSVENFGRTSYRVREIPAFMSIGEAEDFLRDFIDGASEKVADRNSVVISKLITRSCKAAIKGGDRISEAEAAALIKDLKSCVNPFSCPHGRPTFIKLSKYEIEKLFKRV